MTTPNGQSAITLKDRFKYENPTVRTCGPASGSKLGRHAGDGHFGSGFARRGWRRRPSGSAKGSPRRSAQLDATMCACSIRKPQGGRSMSARWLAKTGKKNPPFDQYTYNCRGRGANFDAPHRYSSAVGSMMRRTLIVESGSLRLHHAEGGLVICLRCARRSGRPSSNELETLVACATEGSLAGAGRGSDSRPAVGLERRIREPRGAGAPSAAEPQLRGGEPHHPRHVGDRRREADPARGARRVLGVLADTGSDEPSSIAGLRKLLGEDDVASRVAKLPETRLADAERLLELIMRSTATAMAITVSTPASCSRRTMRSASSAGGRREPAPLGRRASARPEWY